MALYGRSTDPSANGRRSMPSTRISLLLAAVAAIVFVLAVYAISHSVGAGASDSSRVALQVSMR
jgi:hypothetical protein